MAGRIKGITVVIGGDTTGLEKSLKNVNNSIKTTQTNLKDVTRLLKLDPSNTVLLTQKQGYLKTAIEQTKQKLEALKDAQEQAKAQMENGTLGADKYEALQREVVATQESLSKLESQVEQTKSAWDKLGDVGSKMEDIGDSISDAGKNLLPLSAGIAAVGTASMAAWHQMDDAYDSMTSATGALGDKTDELDDTFNKVFGSMPVESKDVSDAISGITQKLGLTGDALESATEQFLKFSAVNNVDVSSAVESVSKAMNDAGISGSEVNTVLDQLTSASQNSGISVDKLASSLSENGTVMRQLGLSTSDDIALLATMEKNGVNVSAVLTGLKYATKTYAAANQDASVEIKKLFDGIKDGSASAADAQEIFGSRAGTILYQYVKEGKLDFQDLANTIKNSTGQLSDTFDATLDPVDQMTVAYNNLKLAGAAMGDSLNTVLAPVFSACASGAQLLANTLLNLPDPIKDTIAAVGVLAGSAGPALMTVGTTINKAGSAIKSISSLGKSLMGLKDKISTAMKGFQLMPTVLSALSNPITIVIAALAALAAIFITLWNNNEQFRNGIINTWNQITSSVGDFVAGIQSRFSGFGSSFSGLMSQLGNLWNSFCNALAPVFQGAFSVLAEVFQGVLNVLTGILDVFIGLFSGNWSQLWTGVQEIFSAIWNTISAVFNTVITTIESLFSGFASGISSGWNSLWSGISSFFESIWNGIVSFFSGMISSIEASANSGMSAVNSTITGIWNGISSFISGIVSGIASSVSSAWNNISSTTSSIFNGIKGVASSVWNGIKSTISSAANNVFSSVSGTFRRVSSTVSSIFNGLRSTVSGIWNGIKSAITGPINSALSTCRNVANGIRNAFSGIRISIPHFALPHLSVSGSFSLNPPSVPHFGISWYKEGGILTGPTIFGMSSSSLLAGGEAGKEAVLPLDSFYRNLGNIISKQMNSAGMEKYLAIIAENSAKGIYLDNGALVGYLLPAIDSELGKKEQIAKEAGCMKPNVKINGISMDSLGWLRESISFPAVASQTDSVVIPGRNSPIRFSVINNRISYQPRTFKIVLVMLGNRTKFMEMESELLQRFLGQLSRVTISEKPDLYVQGTLQMESDYDVDTHKGSLIINCSDADAYFYHVDKTSKSFSGNQQAVLSCDFMPTIPQITVTEQTKLEWFIGQESFSKTLNKGTWTIPELELHQGENTISITTTGKVTFEYQEGCL